MIDVKQVQQLLEALDCSPGAIDGIWGKNSQAAMDKALVEHGVKSSFDSLVESTLNATDNNVGNKTGTFWDTVKYFRREEFRCQCGGKYCNGFPAEPAEKLIRIADIVREKAGKPAHVTSGVRDIQHNANVGGVSGSRHTKGWAMDFYIEGMTSTQLDALVGAQPGVAYHYKVNDRVVHMDVVL